MIRPSKQSKELMGAIAEDSRGQAIDAAKKRAVAQQADYDTFKKLVSVAHLKPLHAPPSSTKGSLLPSWKLNFSPMEPTTAASTAGATGTCAAGTCSTATIESSSNSSSRCKGGEMDMISTAPRESGTSGASQQQQQQQLLLPRNSMEFIREWRRNCPTTEAKYRLLKCCGADALSNIFKVEITGDLLGQLLLVLQQEWVIQARAIKGQWSNVQQVTAQEPMKAQAAAEAAMQEAEFMVQLLRGLTGAGRFDLNARLIGSKAKQAAVHLCDDLAAAITGQLQLQHSGTAEEAEATPAPRCGGQGMSPDSSAQLDDVGFSATGSSGPLLVTDSSITCQQAPWPLTEQTATAVAPATSPEAVATAATAEGLAPAKARDFGRLQQQVAAMVMSETLGSTSHQRKQQVLLQLQHVRCKLCI